MEPVKQGLEISTTNLNKIGLVKVKDQWMWQADVAENVEGGAAEGANEDVEMAGNDTAMGEVGPSSAFQDLSKVLDKLDHLTNEQRNNHEFYTARFQHLDLQIEVVQYQLATIAAWNEPHN